MEITFLKFAFSVIPPVTLSLDSSEIFTVFLLISAKKLKISNMSKTSNKKNDWTPRECFASNRSQKQL